MKVAFVYVALAALAIAAPTQFHEERDSRAPTSDYPHHNGTHFNGTHPHGPTHHNHTDPTHHNYTVPSTIASRTWSHSWTTSHVSETASHTWSGSPHSWTGVPHTYMGSSHTFATTTPTAEPHPHGHEARAPPARPTGPFNHTDPHDPHHFNSTHYNHTEPGHPDPHPPFNGTGPPGRHGPPHGH